MPKVRSRRTKQANYKKAKQISQNTPQKNTQNAGYQDQAHASARMDRREYEKMLAQQSNAKRSQKRRKNRKSFISVFLVLIALIVCAFVCIMVFFKIDTITIHTADLASEAEVLKISGIRKQDNLLQADTVRAQENLLYAIQGADNVTVEKKYPSGVEITITKADPAFCFRGADAFYTVSQSGRIIDKTLEKPQALLLAMGFPNPAATGEFIQKDNFAFQNMQQIQRVFAEVELPEITLIDVSEEFNMKVFYRDRVKIIIGNSSDLDYKMKMLKKTYENEFGADDYGVIDVSVRGSAYVRKGKDYVAQFFDLDAPFSVSAETSAPEPEMTSEENSSHVSASQENSGVSDRTPQN